MLVLLQHLRYFILDSETITKLDTRFRWRHKANVDKVCINRPRQAWRCTYLTHVVVTTPSSPPQSMPSKKVPGWTRTRSPTSKSRTMLPSLILKDPLR